MAKRKDNLYSWEHQRRVQYDQKLKDEQFFKDRERYKEKKAREERFQNWASSSPARRNIALVLSVAVIVLFIVFLKSPDFRDGVQSVLTFIWMKILSVIKWFLPES